MSLVTAYTPATSESARFLAALFGGKPDELYGLLWTLREKESHWFQSVQAAIDHAKGFWARDLYVGAGLAKKDFGTKRRCPSEEIAGIVGVWADIDLRSDAHPGTTLPSTIEQALSILPADLSASFVLNTGNGLQVWWLFREPYLFENDDERRIGGSLVKRWHILLRENASRLGWTYECLADLARVLRVPGTLNCKDPSNPKSVVIYAQSGCRYNPCELAEYLDHAGVPDRAAESSAPHQWPENFRDKPLTINVSTRIPGERLEAWLAADLRFNQTWFRQRQDLHDQSQSGYDLALACFGFSASLAEQEIVDLIIHHRAMHKQKQRTRVDYFQRTLSKAASFTCGLNGKLGAAAPGSAGPWSSENEEGSSGTPERDVMAEKAETCRMLSRVLGVTILSITKITGQSPIFHIDLAEGKALFSTVAKLISQTSVRNTLAGITGKLMRPFKPKDWVKVAQALLDACTIQEGGEEMEMEGSARLRVTQYLRATTFIDALEGQSQDNARKPMVAGGLITVCASDIQTFISKTSAENVTIPVVVGMLSAIGAQSERFRGKFPVQSRWLLPADKFAAADYLIPTGEELFDDCQ